MPLANGNYFPNFNFTAPRSYLYDIDIATYGDGFSGSGSTYFIHAVPPDPTYILIEFWNDWYLWSSKSYQLGDIVQTFSVVVPPSTVRTPIPFDFGYYNNPTTLRPGLFLNWFSGPRLPQIVHLPVQPLDYWSPRPLP